jgi:hypothetical protein
MARTAEKLEVLSPGPCLAVAWVARRMVVCAHLNGHPGTHVQDVEVEVDVPTKLLARVGQATILTRFRVEWGP